MHNYSLPLFLFLASGWITYNDEPINPRMTYLSL
jgi:hypothetical protein